MNESERERLIVRILAMRHNDMSYKRIADALSDENIPTLSGRGGWGKQTVHRIVKEHRDPELIEKARGLAQEMEKHPAAEPAQAAKPEKTAVPHDDKLVIVDKNDMLDIMKEIRYIKSKIECVGNVGKREAEMSEQIQKLEAENERLRGHLAQKDQKADGFMRELQGKLKEIEAERQENEKLRSMVAELERKIEEAESKQTQIPPSHITVRGQRWGIQRKKISGNRYYYAVKRIKGRHISVSIGKDFDEGRAARKIKAKLDKIKQEEQQQEQ